MPGARSYALRLIKSRLRSAWEIDQALLRRGVEVDERRALIDDLQRADLINDKRYAEAWVRTRDRLSPRGWSLLRMELRQRGIADAVIDAVRAERTDDDEEPIDEYAQARDLMERRERQYSGLAPEVRARRLAGYLTRRGFSAEVVRRILNT